MRGVRISGEADLVEEVELGLGAEEAGVSDAGGCQVLLRLAGNVAGVTAEGLAGERIVDEELHVQRLGATEGINISRRDVRVKIHVGFVNGCESDDRRTVEGEAFLGCLLSEGMSRDGHALLGAGNVGKSHVDILDVVVLDVLDDIFGCLEGHGFSSRGSMLVLA